MAASVPFGEAMPLQPDLFPSVRLDATFVLIQLVLVLPVVTLDDRDLLVSQTGDPADDLVEGAPRLQIRNQVMNGDPAGGELEPSATIDQSDLFLHGSSLRACVRREDSFYAIPRVRQRTANGSRREPESLSGLGRSPGCEFSECVINGNQRTVVVSLR